MAGLSHSSQRKGAALISVPRTRCWLKSQQRAYTPAYKQLGALTPLTTPSAVCIEIKISLF